MAQYRRRGIPSILTVHEPYATNAYRAFETASDGIEKMRMFSRWMATLNYEISMCNAFDRVVTMTGEDAAFLRSYARRADIRAIPIGVDAGFYSPAAGTAPSESVEVVFIGNYRHPPNLEGAAFLVEEIAPHFPDIRFVIAGAHLPDNFVSPGNVHLPGHVPDTRTLFRSANTIFAAPLFSGRGQRVKLLEAFAMEAAVITTSLAATGFPIADGRQALIANNAAEFRVAVERLASSAQLRCRLGREARHMIVAHFTWDKIARQLLDLVVECGTA
jgi:glycosyltransferase involved in cell wall biosynthesis